MIEDVKYDIYELTKYYFSIAATRLFDEIYNRKAGVLPSSKFVDLIETLGEGFHGEDLEGQLRKVDPNEIVSLEPFSFVSWYVDLVEGPTRDNFVIEDVKYDIYELTY